MSNNKSVDLRKSACSEKAKSTAHTVAQGVKSVMRPVTDEARQQIAPALQLASYVSIITSTMAVSSLKEQQRKSNEEISLYFKKSDTKRQLDDINGIYQREGLTQGRTVSLRTENDIKYAHQVSARYLQSHDLGQFKNKIVPDRICANLSAEEQLVVQQHNLIQRKMMTDQDLSKARAGRRHTITRIGTQMVSRNEYLRTYAKGVRYGAMTVRSIRRVCRKIHRSGIVGKIGKHTIKGVGMSAVYLVTGNVATAKNTVNQMGHYLNTRKLNSLAKKRVKRQARQQRVQRIRRAPRKLRRGIVNKARPNVHSSRLARGIVRTDKGLRKIRVGKRVLHKKMNVATKAGKKVLSIIKKPLRVLGNVTQVLNKAKMIVIKYLGLAFAGILAVCLLVSFLCFGAVAVSSSISNFFTNLQGFFSEEDVDPMESVGYIVYSEVADLENDFLTAKGIDTSNYDNVEIEYVDGKNKKIKALPNNIKDIISMSSIMTENQKDKSQNFKEYTIDLWKDSHIVKKAVYTTKCDKHQEDWKSECTNLKGNKCGGHKTLVLTLSVAQIPTKTNGYTEDNNIFTLEQEKKRYKKYLDYQKEEQQEDIEDCKEKAEEKIKEKNEKRQEKGEPILTESEKNEIYKSNESKYRLFAGWTKENQDLASLRAAADWEELYGIDVESSSDVNVGFQMVSQIAKYLTPVAGTDKDSVVNYHYADRPRALILKYAFSRIGITPYSQGGYSGGGRDGSHELSPIYYPRVLPEYPKTNASTDCSGFVSWTYAKMLKDFYSGVAGKEMSMSEVATQAKKVNKSIATMASFTPHTTSSLGMAFSNTSMAVKGSNVVKQMKEGKIQAGDILNNPGSHTAIFLKYHSEDNTIEIIEEGGMTVPKFKMNGKTVRNVGVTRRDASHFPEAYKIIECIENYYKTASHNDSVYDVESNKCPWSYPFRFITSNTKRETYKIYNNSSDYTHWTAEGWGK